MAFRSRLFSLFAFVVTSLFSEPTSSSSHRVVYHDDSTTIKGTKEILSRACALKSPREKFKHWGKRKKKPRNKKKKKFNGVCKCRRKRGSIGIKFPDVLPVEKSCWYTGHRSRRSNRAENLNRFFVCAGKHCVTSADPFSLSLSLSLSISERRV